ncbi:hypothetical protein DFJ73DRAFT_900323 [Zopfochytrium polystomum]|nr:hypothetical protein DFJ73DRAFT_900323 [Zopfochytrium polystomum]
MEATKVLICEEGLIGLMLVHAGDGNCHCLLVLDEDSPMDIEVAEHVWEKLGVVALSMGRTVTGEHGFGQGSMTDMWRKLDCEIGLELANHCDKQQPGRVAERRQQARHTSVCGGGRGLDSTSPVAANRPTAARKMELQSPMCWHIQLPFYMKWEPVEQEKWDLEHPNQ